MVVLLLLFGSVAHDVVNGVVDEVVVVVVDYVVHLAVVVW